jgi:hypothetical protein
MVVTKAINVRNLLKKPPVYYIEGTDWNKVNLIMDVWIHAQDSSHSTFISCNIYLINIAVPLQYSWTSHPSKLIENVYLN